MIRSQPRAGEGVTVAVCDLVECVRPCVRACVDGCGISRCHLSHLLTPSFCTVGGKADATLCAVMRPCVCSLLCAWRNGAEHIGNARYAA